MKEWLKYNNFNCANNQIVSNLQIISLLKQIILKNYFFEDKNKLPLKSIIFVLCLKVLFCV